MDNLTERLIQCFSAVFPDLSPDQLRTSSLARLPEWDSIASITLLTLIEEEFGIQIPPAALSTFVSFEAIHGYLSRVTD